MKNHGILAESHICVLLKSIEIMEGYSGFQKEVVSASKVMIYHPRPDPTRLEFQTNQVWRETKHHKKLQKVTKRCKKWNPDMTATMKNSKTQFSTCFNMMQKLADPVFAKRLGHLPKYCRTTNHGTQDHPDHPSSRWLPLAPSQNATNLWHQRDLDLFNNCWNLGRFKICPTTSQTFSLSILRPVLVPFLLIGFPATACGTLHICARHCSHGNAPILFWTSSRLIR